MIIRFKHLLIKARSEDRRAGTLSRSSPTLPYWKLHDCDTSVAPRCANLFPSRGFLGTISPRKIVDLAICFVLGDSVAFLYLANQLITFPGDHMKVIVGELAPFLADFSCRLRPLSFHLVPVH